MSEYLYYKVDGRRAKVRADKQAEFESKYPDAKIYYNYQGRDAAVPISGVEEFKQKYGADNVSYSVFDDFGTSASNTESNLPSIRDERQARREERQNDGKTTFGETLGKSAAAAGVRTGKLALDLARAAWNTGVVGGAINFMTGKKFDDKLRDEDSKLTQWSMQLGETADRLSREADPTGGEKGYVDLIKEGNIGQVAQKALASGIESLPMMLAAGSGWGMLLYGAGMAAGEYSDETRENPDIPSWKRAINSMGSAALEMAVEKIGGPLNDLGKAGKEITEDMAKEILETAVKEGSDHIAKRIVKKLGTMVKQGAEEGVEEVITSFGNDVLGTSLDLIDGDADYGIQAQWNQLKEQNPDASLADFAKEKGKEYMDAFIGGAVSGLEISTTTEGLGAGVNALRNNESRNIMEHAREVGSSMSYDDLYDTDSDVANAKTAVANSFADKDGNPTISNEFIESLSAEDAYALAGREDFSYQQRRAFGELAIAKAKSDALNGRLDTMRDERVATIRSRMEKASENGQIVTGMVDGRVVYVRGGKVNNRVVSVDKHGGHGPLLVIDSVTGEEKVVNSKDITSASVLNAEETINGMVNFILNNEASDRQTARTTMSKRAKIAAVNEFIGKRMMINSENGIIEVEVTASPQSGKVLIKGKKGDLGGQAIKPMDADVFYDSIYRNENGEPVFVEKGEGETEEVEVPETPTAPETPEAPVAAGVAEDDDFRDFTGTILVDGAPLNVSVISQDGPSDTIVYEYEDENGNTRRASTTIGAFKAAVQQGAEYAPEAPAVPETPVAETPVAEEVPPTEETPTEEEAPVGEVELGPDDIDWDALFDSDPEAYFVELQKQFGDGAIDMLTAVVEATQEELDDLNKNKGKTQKEIFANVTKKKELQNKIDILNGMIERLTATPSPETAPEVVPDSVAEPMPEPAPETAPVVETPAPAPVEEPAPAEPVETEPVEEPAPEVVESPAPAPETTQPTTPETPDAPQADNAPIGGALNRMFEAFKAQVDKIASKANIKDFIGKDETKPAMTGIYHAGGYDYASDSMVLAKLKSNYPSSQEGKMFSVKTGKEITAKVPAYEVPINDALKGDSLEVNIDDIIAYAQTLEEIKKGLGKSTNFYVKIGNSAFRSDIILTAAKLAKQQGLTTVLQRTEANRAMAFTGDNGVILAMPVTGWDPKNLLDITDGKIEVYYPEIKTPTTLKGIQTAKTTLEAILPNLNNAQIQELKDTEGIKLVDGKVFVFFDSKDIDKAMSKSKDAITYAALESIKTNGLEVSLSKDEIATLFPESAKTPESAPESAPVAETPKFEIPYGGFIMEDGYIVNPIVIEMPGVEGESNKIYLAEHNGKWGVSQYAVMDNGNSSGSEKNGRVQKEWITYDTPEEAIVKALKYFDFYRKDQKRKSTSEKIDTFMQWIKDTYLKDSGLEVPEVFIPEAPNPVDDPIKEAKKREKSLATQLKRIGIPHEQKQDMAFNVGKAVADMFATREEYEDYAEDATDFGEYNADFERGVDASFANRPQNPDDTPGKSVPLENEPKDGENGGETDAPKGDDTVRPADGGTGGGTDNGGSKAGDKGNPKAIPSQGKGGSEGGKESGKVKHQYPARKGNVTGKILVDTFGLAAVDIPNSRKEILNTFYDFMMEMSKVLGISPKSIGNGGWLTLGNLRANARAFARHTVLYKTFGGDIVEQHLLLKYSRVSSIAHEWWHALDHALSFFEKGKNKGPTTEIATGAFDGRQETLEAVRAIMQAIRDSGYTSRIQSHPLYTRDFKNYVLEPTESAARAFAEYMRNKFAENGIAIAGVNEFYDDTQPTSEEMKLITPAIENLFKVLQEKEGKTPGTSILYHIGEMMDEQSDAKKLATEAVLTALDDTGIEVVRASDEQTQQIIDASGENTEFMISPDNPVFVSNAAMAVAGIKMEKATPEQWLKMIEKAGGLKVGEDKWIGLSDWLKASDKKTLTKKEVLDYIHENEIKIEEVNYAEIDYFAEDKKFIDAINAEYLALRKEAEDAGEWIHDAGDIAYQQMVDKYGDDFSIAFGVDRGELYVSNREAASAVTGVDLGTERAIDETRIGYTTEGLSNNKEIALVVPTIESWNESDEIHFGDAGNGRAVAWVRFGETEVTVQDETQQRLNEIYDRLAELEMKVSSTGITEEEYNERARLRTERDELQEIKPKTQRVLVIDEIQSKRHQEGRESGYKVSREKADAEMDKFMKRMHDKYNFSSSTPFAEVFNEEEMRELARLTMQQNRATFGMMAVPDAPFDKNWHELAMKRMLRYAAENGYDAIAWTKGEQQTERYQIGGVVDFINVNPRGDEKVVLIRLSNGGVIEDFVNSDGEITQGQHYGQKLSDVVGKEIAEQILTTDETYYDGGDLKVGGEGMKGFYDKMLPAFMNKYGKKWGIKVADITLPNVERAGRVMHSVPVTDAMKESVMEGQPMFMKRPNGTVYGWTDGKKIYLTNAGINPNTPVHEYTHLWAKAMMQKNPKGWQSIKDLLRGTPVWNEVLNDPNYSSIHSNEDLVASEVLSRISGTQNAAKLEQMAQQMIDEAKGTARKLEARGLIQNIKDALNKFWNWVGTELFGIEKFESVEQITDRVLWDLMNKTDLGELSEGQVETQIVTDPKVIAELEASPKRTGYRNVVQNEDGSFSSPMAYWLQSTKGGAKTRVETAKFELGKWEEAEEHPELVDENGHVTLVKPNKSTVEVAYDPYIHNRLDPVNLQFKDAWKRDELVYVETEVPETDLESGYHADKALLPVGVHSWSNGDLILSKYDKPVRIMQWDAVADAWVERLNGEGVHFDVVPPALRPLLVERGVEILPPHKGMGKDCNDAYEEWKKENENNSLSSQSYEGTGEHNTVSDGRGEGVQEELPVLRPALLLGAGPVDGEVSQADFSRFNPISKRDGESDRQRNNRENKFLSFINGLTSDEQISLYAFLKDYSSRPSGVLRERATDFINSIRQKGNNSLADFVEDFISDELKYREGVSSAAVAKHGLLVGIDQNLSAIERMFYAFNKDKYNGVLFDRVLKLAKRFGVTVKFATRNADGSFISEYGSYNPNDNSITLDANLLVKGNENELCQTILHELIHSVVARAASIMTGRAVNRNNQFIDPQSLPKDVIDGINTLKEVYEAIKDDGTFQDTYGKKDFQEMLSEITDPKFRGLLKAKKLWKKFLNGICQILGIADEASSESDALTEIESALDKILSAAEQGGLDSAYASYLGQLADGYTLADLQRLSSGPVKTLLTQNKLFRTGVDPDEVARETAKAVYERIVNENWQEFQRQFQDAMQPVRIAIDAIQQETGNLPIEDYENFLLMFNQASSRSRVEIDEFSRRYYSPIIESINEVINSIIEAHGGKASNQKQRAYAYKKIMTYLIAKHGLERNKYYQETKTRKLTAAEKAKEVSKAQKAYEDEIDAINAMELTDEERVDMLGKAQEQFNAELEDIETREVPDMRDYSGLTSLFGLPPKKFKQAEEEAQELVDDFEKMLGRVDDESGETVTPSELIEKLWKNINAATSKTLRHSYESGMLSRQQYNDIKDMFKFYIPLRGFNETTAEDVYSYARFEGNRFNPAVHKAKGRTSVADDPIATIMNMAESEIAQGNKNRAKQALYNFLLNRAAGKAYQNSLMQVESVWYLKKEDESGKEYYEIAVPNRDAGETYEEFEERMKVLEAEKKAMKSKKGKLKIGMRFQKPANMNAHYVFLKVNGVEKAIYINGDPKAAQAINGEHKKQRGALAEKMGILNRFISSMFTNYSLEFTARNYFRDMFYSHINIDVKESDPAYRKKFRQNWRHNNLRSMVNMLKAYRAGEYEGRDLNEDEMAFVEFMRNGGQTGYTLINSVETHKKDLERAIANMQKGIEKGGVKDSTIFKFTLGSIELLNEASELVTRFAAFKTSRDMGRGINTSIADAKEVTVNFNTKGAQDGKGFMGMIAHYFGWSKYFFNASVQGVQNLKSMAEANKLKFGSVIGGMIATGFLMPVITSAIASLFGNDDEEYWNIPEYERQNNFCVPIGNGKYVKVPLPIGFREVYAIGDMVAAAAFDKKFTRDLSQVGTDIANKLASIILPINPLESTANGLGFWHMFAYTTLPSFAQVAVQNLTNTDWKGAPLQKEYTYNEDDPQWMKAFASNPDWMKGLSKWCNEHINLDGDYEGMDWSPEKLDNTLSNVFGGIYSLVKKTGKSISMIWNEENRNLSNIPLSGVVLGSGIDNDDRFVTDAYYDMKEYYDSNVNYINRMAKRFGYTLEDVFEKEKGKHHPKMNEIYSNENFDFMQEWYTGVKELDAINDKIKKLDKKIAAKETPTEQDMLKWSRLNDKYLTERRDFVNDMLELD